VYDGLNIHLPYNKQSVQAFSLKKCTLAIIFSPQSCQSTQVSNFRKIFQVSGKNKFLAGVHRGMGEQ
jgi:hypothetical protein